MRTDLLLGTKFANSDRMKQEILNDYMGWKSENIYELDRKGTLKFAFGQLMGVSEKELAKMVGMESSLPDIDEISNLLDDQGCRHYYVSKSVLKWTVEMGIPKDYQLKELLPIPDGKRQLSYGDDFYRYEKIGGEMVVLSGHLTTSNHSKTPDIQYDLFKIDLHSQTLHTTDAAMRRKFEAIHQRRFMEDFLNKLDNRTLIKKHDKNYSAPMPGSLEYFEERMFGKRDSSNDHQEKGTAYSQAAYEKAKANFEGHMLEKEQHRNFFISLLSFMHISKVQEVTVKPGSRHANVEDEIDLTNKEKFDMTIVNNVWNKIIKIGGSKVKPHHRTYYVGKDRQNIERKYILAHTRGAYKRNAGKIKDEIKTTLEQAMAPAPKKAAPKPTTNTNTTKDENKITHKPNMGKIAPKGGGRKMPWKKGPR